MIVMNHDQLFLYWVFLQDSDAHKIIFIEYAQYK